MKLLIDTIVDIITAILNFFFEGIEGLWGDHASSDASWGNPNKHISSSNTGWCVDGKRFLNLDTSRRNFCVVAGSGKGKTQVHIFPTILQTTASMCVNDNSGELAHSTIGYLQNKGVKTLVMNLTRKSGVYLNPLDFCSDVASMRKIAKALMANASEKNDFFSLSAEDCISLFIQYVMESEPRIYANLANVYRLILEYQGSPKVIEQLFAEKASEAVWIKFKALAGNSEKTLKSITATALSALSWIGDNEILADISSITNIRFEDFRKSQHILYIQSPVSDAKFYAPMVSLVFKSFYRFAFSHLPSKDDLDIMMVLDEFSSLVEGMPDYSQIISNSRKFKIPQCIVLQSESQLSKYGELKDNILQNCFVKCYYGGGQEKKAFELEKILGSYTYTDKKTERTVTRPLLSATQIRQLDNEIIVLPNGKKPLKLKVTPAYKQSKLRKRMAIEISQSEEAIPEYSVQYIDLSKYKQAITDTTESNEVA